MNDSIKTSLRTGVAVLTVTGLTMTGIAVAQTDDTQPADEGTGDSTQPTPGFRLGRGHHRGAGIVATVAELTGLTAQQVIDEIADDTTSIADVAAANGSSGQAVVDAAVANLTERLDQAVADERISPEDAADKLADAETRITENVNDDAFTPRGRHGHRGAGKAVDAEALAGVLGITTDDLQQAREDGVSLADLAEQQGVAVDDVVDVLVAPLVERLDQAVSDERITQEEADDKLADAETRITERVESDTPLRGPGFGGRRGFGPPASEAVDA